jgi:hypothetical protein
MFDFITKLHGILAGKKTYIVCALAIAGAIFGYLTGDLTFGQSQQDIVTALTGITLRSGLKREVTKTLTSGDSK